MIVATNNEGKLKEIRAILKDFELESLKEKGIDIDILEDEDTFYGNAYKKAVTIYELTKESVLADDSGLCIEVLHDWPGIKTHRFYGEDATDSDRNKAILEKLKNVRNRRARAVCVIVYYDGENTLASIGEINGEIALEERGKHGFGFDPIFLTKVGKTLGELPSSRKNSVSARYKALKEIRRKIKKLSKDKLAKENKVN